MDDKRGTVKMATSPGVSTTHRPISNPKTVERFSPYQIGYRFIELVMYLGLYTIRFAMRLLLNKVRRRKVSWRIVFGQSLAELCEALGATFIKIGQILSTRCDLIPQDMIAPLIQLQDHIKPFEFRHVPMLIRAQFGQPLTEIFAEFNEQPISSASVASVYEARR